MPSNVDTIVLREATPADAAAYTRLMDVLGYPTTLASAQARLDTIRCDPGYHTVVAELKGEIKGLLGLRRGWAYEVDEPIVQMFVLVVDAESQGQGIGTALVQHAEEWARGLGAAGISLVSGYHRPAAHRFYEHRGYELHGHVFLKKLTS
jgi:GNAT superfamily N-acetyltransferase